MPRPGFQSIISEAEFLTQPLEHLVPQEDNENRTGPTSNMLIASPTQHGVHSVAKFVEQVVYIALSQEGGNTGGTWT